MVYELPFKLLKEDQKETHHNIMEDQANTKEKQVLLSSTRISVINLLSPGIIWLCLYQRRLPKRGGVWPKHLQVWARIRIQQGDRRGNRNKRTRDTREHSLPGKGYQWKEYVGTLSKSEKGKTCMGWKGTKMEGRQGTGEHNYCRNPDNHKNFGGGVWCYVDRRGKGGHWEACDVDWCVDE